ncbi:hypothetical protein [Micromonospora echinofusca]|uniref:Uncharacterized protein n=1 Tax=Micromonospora echinofusca TaxID=47858 RepID=A0ABS3VPY0_MICEH|nr:hypothetical protein [Micromonospora echinofusca]MBO4206546.1 hypothetical protein [Micromonospora echinofusca]
MLRKLHDAGLRAEHCYIAGFVSVGLSFSSWFLSKHLERSGIDRADRWGIFVGEWAPTFFAIGNGLQMYEK